MTCWFSCWGCFCFRTVWLLCGSCCFCVTLDDGGESFRSARHRLSNLVGVRNHEHELLEASLKKRLVHALVPSLEEELHANAVSVGEPFGCLLRLETHIVLSRAYFDLYFLGLRDLYLAARGTFFLASLVLEFTIIHDFRNGRHRVRRDLNEVQTEVLGHFKGFVRVEDAEVLSLGAYNSEFRGPNLSVYADSIGVRAQGFLVYTDSST
ncbi:MAG: hypothetical protein QG636_258 [Patescibacteria group bacterium]|nr:hypothetical protein [Patescibacteria group bacterium]